MRALLTSIIMLTSTLAAGAEVEIVSRQQGGKAYERMEWEIRLPRAYENPFDPAEITVDGHFTSPDGKQTIALPAFWSQQFTNNRFGHHEKMRAKPEGEGFWLVRFAPPSPGTWSMQFVVRDRQGQRELPKLSFEVAPGESRGFVRRAPGNARYFQFDNGKPFFPVGLNIAWGNADTGLADYERLFKKLADGGGNFARIWMSHPNRMTETNEAGPGKLDMAAMDFYDQLFALAEKHGIYLMVCFNNHRDLLMQDEYGEGRWPHFPYNAKAGGPATRPVDFLTQREARELYKRRLRYVVARYSSFTNVAFWEFWNEQEFTKLDVPLDWTREMAEHLKQIDPYQHLVTTSAKVPPEQYALDAIDLTQSHLYVGGSPDLIGPVVASARKHERFGKPHVVGEIGIGNGHDGDVKRNDSGTSVHNSMWASAISGCAGSSWHWWWDNYVEPKNLWHEYGALARFAATVDWPRRNFVPVELPLPVIPGKSKEAFYDLTLACTENWGYKLDGDVVVRPNGLMSQTLPHYWVSATKPELYSPARFVVDLPRASTMVLRVSSVCDAAMLRAMVDDVPVADFPLSALPGAPDVKDTKQRPQEPGKPIVYEAKLNVERSVDLPAGKHVVNVANIGGDWASLESITLRGALSSRNQLATLALQDSSAGETIAWVYDVRSHWQSDRDGVEPTTFDGVTLSVPVDRAGPMRVEWWDTRKGTVIRSDDVTAAGGVLQLTAPAFTRDVALRVFPSP